MRDIHLEAAVLRAELLSGSKSVEDAVAWADEVISAEAKPEPWLFDISLGSAKKPDDMADLLGATGTQELSLRAAISLASRMLQEFTDDESAGSRIARQLYRLVNARCWPT